MAGDEEEKKADEDKDLELDLMAEAELLRLTRQYRIMEGDKEAYCEEAQKVLRRQRKILADLGGSTWQNNPACQGLLLVLKTIHRFHNRFSQSQRRPLLTPTQLS